MRSKVLKSAVRKPPNAGKGRVKGVPNKATKAAREAIAVFVDGNAERLQGWLDAVAVKDPERAFSLFLSLVEYHVPKLARTELSGPNGGDIPVGGQLILVRPSGPSGG